MTSKATGTFDIEMKPAEQIAAVGGSTVGRMTIEKQYAGDLVGSASGQMLTAMSGTPGSAGYVAVELVQGTLAGHTGAFMLQHTGVMSAAGAALDVIVVPDSGTDGLVGISGSLEIINDDGKHNYVLTYELPHKSGP